HDLDQLVFRLVDARHIVERDFRSGCLVVAARLAATDSHEAAHAKASALLRRTSIEPDIEPDQENRRTEAEKKRRPWAAFTDRHRTDLHVVTDQKRLQSGIDKGRELGRERVRRSRCGLGQFALLGHRLVGALCRPGDGSLEAALDAVAAAVNGRDVALGDLLLEYGVRNGDRLTRPG